MTWLLWLALAASPREEFNKAICAGDVPRAASLLEQDPSQVSEGNRLVLAAKCAQPETLKLLLSKGARAAEPDAQGLTALHHAALRSALAPVQVLLSVKAPVDARTQLGETPLMLALGADKPSLAVVQALLAAGAETNTQDARGRSVLEDAVYTGDLALIDAVLPLVDVKRAGTRPLETAVGRSWLELLDRLVAAGASFEPTATWQGGLHTAVRTAQLQSIRYLAKRVKSVDVQDPTHARKTPLHVAAELGLAPEVRLLLELGANPLAKDSSGKTPRDLAEGQGAVEVVRILLQKMGTPPASTDPAEQQFAVIFGGGKQPADATRWLASFEAEAAQVWRPHVLLSEGFPKVLRSDDVPGMNPGFHVVVLGFCSAAELGPAMKVLKVSAERLYSRKVTSAPHPRTCPRPILQRRLLASDVSTVGDEGVRLHLAAFEGANGAVELLATARDAQGALLDHLAQRSIGGEARASGGELELRWEDRDASCGPPATGLTRVSWRGEKIIAEELPGPSTWKPSCGE